ncbi:putative transcription factor bHLH family [Medicago truncatula]|uniref:Basic helix loop helix (BHLH) DNA-binding family protein n=1 Tax=Medicago truncatula TaxID=3880 RepID=F0V437_MEDTR|nr:transcription factor bHLH94 [Medicago truncatula]AES73101.1 basic helix loop helix (BHLH) DNA-binding family protein [Medicago truncatula]RHN70149.1 putative transcription factor bHLH family [Medicago truncatula]CBX31916.1 basic helix loop helix 1 [Medicago truncatula]
MALETVVFPQQDPFTYSYKDNYFNSLNNDYDHLHAEEQENVLLGIINNEQQNLHANWDHQWEYSHSSSPEICTVDQTITAPPSSTMEEATVTASCRRKRRRIKSAKNKEEIENQRMTHITVERNRRKQMNEYLNVLRSLMPSSYVQRGDQASIIGGAINFVKELEQHLQSMGGQKKTKEPNENIGLNNGPPFAEFFTFPQYTTSATQNNNNNNNVTMEQHNYQEQKQWAVADIEVTMVDSHANMKILSKKKPGQLMKIVVGLQNLRLTILHLNVTTVDDMVLYSVSIKVEEGSQLNSVDEIAAAVNRLLRTVQQELAYQLN